MTAAQIRRSMGLCPRCGEKPSGGRVYCLNCYDMLRTRPSQAPRTTRRGKCPLCGEVGHYAKTCLDRRAVDASK